MVSPYEVLQVDPDADEAAIEAAYRERVKEAHPDHGGSPTEFRLVRLAYEEVQEGPIEGEDPGEDRSDGRTESRDRPDAGPARATPGDRTVGARRPGGRHGPTPRRERRWSARWRGRVRAHVEYLNYDALDDHGWTLEDEDLFEKAAAADLDPADHGEVLVEPGDSLLEAAEDAGFAWPFSCRGGACANCAVAVVEGELAMSVDTVLPDRMLEEGIRLSCIGAPVVEDTKVVFNVKHLPDLEELRLPPRSFAGAAGDD